ncbi:MAG: site-specific DNA-methyltransferase [bacterium]|nr:site-specific DNA-methyltransferase [bacterium]
MTQMTQPNTLYYGDNLDILRKYLPEESVDLVYLDPPFNSNRDYNLLFKEQSGEPAQAQIKAFTDTWQWSERAYVQFCEQCPLPALVELLQGFVRTLGRNDLTAYLVMMAPRLVELHRVLKSTGSLYLHCDPTVSHYLKVMLDVIFGAKNFKNEIIWQRITSKGNVQRKFGAIHDVLLYYAKQRGRETWNQFYRPLREEYANSFYRYVEEGTGRRYSLGDLTAPMQRASRGQVYEWRGIVPPPTRCWVYSIEKMEELYAAGRIVFTRSGFPRYKRYLDEVAGEKVTDIWDDIFQLSTKKSLSATRRRSPLPC